MAGMSASKRNRIRTGVDNPINGDGFYLFRRGRGNRKGGAPTGGRGWRRAIRAKESTEFRKEIRNEVAD